MNVTFYIWNRGVLFPKEIDVSVVHRLKDVEKVSGILLGEVASATVATRPKP